MGSVGAIPLRLLPAGVLLLLLVSMAQSPLRLAPDAGLYVEAGQLLLAGKRPYVDFVEVNPPLIIYVNALPAAVALACGVHPVVAFNAFVLLLIAYSTWATRRQLARMREAQAFDLSPDLVAAAWAAYSLWLWLTAPFEINDFGQREHLFVLTWVPYFLVRCAPRRTSRGARLAAVACGFVAGVGCCLKPHLLAVALSVEAALALARRSLRSAIAPESLALAAAAALYALHFALLPHEVREAFFGRWLPFAARYYSAYALSYAYQVDPRLLVVTAAGIAAIALSRWSPLRHTPRSALYAGLGVFAVGGVAAYYVQGKGFPYHQIPAVAGGVLLAALGVSDALTALALWLMANRRRWLAAAPLLVAAPAWLLLARSAPVVAGHRDDGNRFLAGFQKTIDTYADADEPVVILSTSAWPEYPTMAQLDRLQGTRYLSLVYLALAMAARADGDEGRSEALLLGELAEDLRQNRPPVVIVWNPSCRTCAQGRLVGELMANQEMAAALAGYVPGNPAGLPGNSTLLVRADRAARGGARSGWR